MKEKLTQMCKHSETQTETAHVNDEAIKTTSGTGIAYSRPHMRKASDLSMKCMVKKI